jgi:hypothetical protein
MMKLFLNQSSSLFLTNFQSKYSPSSTFLSNTKHAYIPIIYIFYIQPEQPTNFIDTHFNL